MLVLTTGVGLWRRRRDGVLRPVAPLDGPSPRSSTRVGPGLPVSPGLLVALGVEPGVPVTLLQFSSEFCAPCRATRRILAEVAETLPGVRHVEIDAASSPTGVRALSIWRTPTVLVVDADGRVLHRVSGVPERTEVVAAVTPLLTPLLPETPS
ncbi:thioredoxin family protein [Plantactinospora sp. S1510]|uniref:Thioredoxin family protein n=1 Tax=Plantactinospora alkalitolerans TaxID=2789879 RepID=A0ABS0H251_9ACTN|nr:thioredoxin family protein [Plantactinospora alkalitolerans]